MRSSSGVSVSWWEAFRAATPWTPWWRASPRRRSAPNSERGAHVAIGTGLPEDAVAARFASGRAGDFRFHIESGAVGGVPASGAYFGAAFGPKQIVSTADLFARCKSRLDAACLGALEIDAAGDVNVSKRGLRAPLRRARRLPRLHERRTHDRVRLALDARR
jgi:hypothetical protein